MIFKPLATVLRMVATMSMYKVDHANAPQNVRHTTIAATIIKVSAHLAKRMGVQTSM